MEEKCIAGDLWKLVPALGTYIAGLAPPVAARLPHFECGLQTGVGLRPWLRVEGGTAATQSRAFSHNPTWLDDPVWGEAMDHQCTPRSCTTCVTHIASPLLLETPPCGVWTPFRTSRWTVRWWWSTPRPPGPPAAVGRSRFRILCCARRARGPTFTATQICAWTFRMTRGWCWILTCALSVGSRSLDP